MAKMILKHFDFYRSKHTSSSRNHPPSPTVIEELCHRFSLADLSKSTNNFDESRKIEKGLYGRVYKGCLQHNGATDCTVAVKRIWKSCTFGHEERFKKEIELLCQLRHPNLVSLIGFCDHKDEKFIVYEYVSNGSLSDRLYNREMDMEPLSWMKRLEICIGAARALHYLHSGTKCTIFHRDIKSSNILLDNNMVPKLTGFELSLRGPRFMSKPKPIQVDTAGTYGFLAPEHAIDGTFTDRSDVYSFGMVLLEVVSAKKPHTIFEGIEESIDPILQGKIAPECWEIFVDIMKRCLKYDPDERPIIGEVEVELERALSLQEEADIRNTNSYYTLLSITIQFGSPELEQDTDIEDIYSEDTYSEDL